MLPTVLEGDLRFEPYSRILIVGESNTGKSEICRKLILHNSQVFRRGFDKIFLFYKVLPSYSDEIKSFANVEFHKGLEAMPSILNENKKYFESTKIAFFFEDLDTSAYNSPDIVDIFKVYAHNLPLEAVVLTTQDLTSKDKYQPSIKKNASHFIFTQSLRNQGTTDILGRSYFPHKPRSLFKAFELAVADPTSDYSYLCFHTQAKKERLRFYTGLFPGEQLKLFVEETKK